MLCMTTAGQKRASPLWAPDSCAHLPTCSLHLMPHRDLSLNSFTEEILMPREPESHQRLFARPGVPRHPSARPASSASKFHLWSVPFFLCAGLPSLLEPLPPNLLSHLHSCPSITHSPQSSQNSPRSNSQFQILPAACETRSDPASAFLASSLCSHRPLAAPKAPHTTLHLLFPLSRMFFLR